MILRKGVSDGVLWRVAAVAAAAALLAAPAAAVEPFTVLSWGSTFNSPFSSSVNPWVQSLHEYNITEVWTTNAAVLLRIPVAQTEEEPGWNHDATAKNVADPTRGDAVYVVYGENNKYATISNNGAASVVQLTSAVSKSHDDAAALLKRVQADINAAASNVGNSRTFIAADVCVTKNLIFVTHEEGVGCVGCTVKPPTEKNATVLCGGKMADAALIVPSEMTDPELLITTLKVAGDGVIPTAAFNLTESQLPITSFVANSRSGLLLLADGELQAWGDADYGGELPTEYDLSFMRKVVANELGFAALNALSKVISWGNFRQDVIPDRILPGGSEMVERLFARGPCFVALSQTGDVAAWGAGDNLICCEHGGGASAELISLGSIQSSLGAITEVYMANETSALVDGEGKVYAFGHRARGGSLAGNGEGGADAGALWDPADIHSPVEGSVVNTEQAFMFVRTDTLGVAWGASAYGGVLTRDISTQGVASAAASDEGFGAILNSNQLYRWPGETTAIFAQDDRLGDFNIPHPPRFVAGGHRALVAILGTDCQYSEWSAWSACSAACDAGTRSRTRTKISDPLNGFCDLENEVLEQRESCFVVACEPEEKPAPALNVPQLVLAAGGVVAAASLVGVLVHVGIRRRRRPRAAYGLSGDFFD